MATESTPFAKESKLRTSSIGSRSSFSEVYDETDNVAVKGAPSVSSVNRFAAILNLVNVIVGSGIVGLSFVAKSSGILPFSLFMCISGFLAFQTLQFLVASTSYTDGQKSFEAVARTAIGQQGVVLTAVAICMQNIGGMTSRLILVRSVGPPVLKMLGLTNFSTAELQVFMTVLFCYPLCLLKDLSILAFTCFFALCVFVLVMCTSVVYFSAGDGWYNSELAKVSEISSGTAVNWTSLSVDAFEQFPTIIFAFVCHTACLPIYSQLKDATTKKMSHVNLSSILIALMLYSVTGVAGYLTYKGHTMKALLLNFRHCWEEDGECVDDNPFIAVLNGTFLLALLLGYPSIHFPTRRAVIALIWGVDKEFSWLIHCGVATCLVGLTLSIALLCEDVSKAFSWTGAIASPLIVFILPSFYYQQLLGKIDKVAVFDAKRLWPICVMCFGIAFIGISLGVKIQKLTTSAQI